MRTAPRSGDAVGRSSSAVAEGADGGAGTPDAASAGASTTPTGRPARAKTSAASRASAPPQSESGERRRTSSAEPATAAAISTAASASAVVVTSPAITCLLEPAKQRASAPTTGTPAARSGGPARTATSGSASASRTASSRSASVAGTESPPARRRTRSGTPPGPAVAAPAASHTRPAPSVTSCSGARPARTNVAGADWAAASAAAPSAPSSSSAAACTRATSSSLSTRRARRACVVRIGRAWGASVVGSVTGCSLPPRRARPAAGRGSSAPARTRAARHAVPACARPRAP